ncbi:MAG: LysR family transcriptional regulator [Alphaproteobacteria bacterium]|nr:LysR family transcriptional regulator [Alphaproteobacteria bacterium]
MNWDDLRYVLSVARSGTLSAAADQLDVNQTTVARRLAAIEHDLGARLFDRVDRRMVATAVGASVVAHAETMEGAADRLERTVAGRDTALSGTVRLTSVESLLASFLVPRLAAFRDTYPDIALELIGDNTNLNLARREADIALRLARPREGVARTRRLADIGYAIYGNATYMTGRSALALPDLDWIGHDETLSHIPEAVWCRRSVPGFQPVLRCNGVHAMVEAVKAGIGVGILPCYRGDSEPGLVRVTGAAPVVRRELWMLVHGELLKVSRVRSVVDWLASLTGAHKSRLSGQHASTD